MKAIERLEELLNKKDAELSRLQNELDELHREKEWGWARHIFLDTADALPVPRVEIRLIAQTDDWYNTTWDWGVVYERPYHIDHVLVPFGQSRRGGGSRRPDFSERDPDLPAAVVDARRLAKQLRLPCYAICEEQVLLFPDSIPA